MLHGPRASKMPRGRRINGTAVADAPPQLLQAAERFGKSVRRDGQAQRYDIIQCAHKMTACRRAIDDALTIIRRRARAQCWLQPVTLLAAGCQRAAKRAERASAAAGQRPAAADRSRSAAHPIAATFDGGYRSAGGFLAKRPTQGSLRMIFRWPRADSFSGQAFRDDDFTFLIDDKRWLYARPFQTSRRNFVMKVVRLPRAIDA